MASVRCGPSIREFLEYYVLVLLDGKRRTTRELVGEIESRSAENRPYRSSGALHIGIRQMESVLYRLADQGWVRVRLPGGQWGITGAGRRARREIEQESPDASDSKQAATWKLIARLKHVPRRSYVLDVGTGEGFLARKLARRGFRVLGIDSGAFDYSKDSIEKARKGVGSDNGRLEFRRADVTELPRPRGGFDYVVSSQAVHCMEDQPKCLEAIYHLLKPGGRFLAVDFLVGREGFFAHGFHCFLAISREEWADLLPAVGFDDIRMHKVKNYLVVEARRPSSAGDARATASAAA
jgi:ubiquinone/menaquinone biosynthesis C-methylase UbiE